MRHNVLTTRTVEEAKGPARLCDGMGLYLQISRYGSKAWVFRYDFAGRTREMGLGSVHTVPLKLARELAREQREHLLRGDDPIELRAAKIDKARALTAERITFKEAAEEFIAVHAPTWRNAKHRQQWHTTIKDYAYRTLGSRPVSAITGAVITETLAPIWMTKTVTARRVKGRIERVCQWVKDGKPLPQQVTKNVNHHAAVAVDELPAFMAELRERNSVAARALEFLILTAARTGEVLGARWDEIDLKEATWTIPGERMKRGRQHIVPLSEYAMAILKSLPRQGDHIFVSTRDGQPIGHTAMRDVLRDMRGHGDTVHGFRSSFTDWAGDRTNHPHEVIEFALAHGIPDATKAAYRRYTALAKRRALMESWAQFCEPPATGATVTTLRRA